MADDGLRFSILGPVQAWRGAAEVELGTPQERLVLAAMLLRPGSALSADSLIEAVWGEDPPESALGTLRTYISRLRKALEPEQGVKQVLVRQAGGYSVRADPDAIDVARFDLLVRRAEQARAEGDHESAVRDLRDALEQWESSDADALAGLPGTFATDRRARLHERRVAIAELRFDSELALGRHREILDELRALAAAHPVREKLQGQLMVALHREGRQADALEVYTRTRDHLVDTLGIDPGADLRRIHAQVLEGDPDAGAEAQARPTPRPRQLPADVATFTGRAEALEQLQQALTMTSHASVALLTGIGGVGKTTLAVHAAHAVRDRFPDGQLYADLRGTDDEPAHPEDVLRMFLRSLGVPRSEVPAGLEECAALFRSTVADRRVLVLLDNVREAAQVRPILPGHDGCATLVTSRWQLPDIAATCSLRLSALEPTEALDLFTSMVGDDRVHRESGEAAELLAAGGYLPLSVRILAARLAVRPAWSIASLASRLDDERRRLDELSAGELAVSASFQLSYAQLGDNLKRACRLLSLYTGPMLGVEVASAILEEPEAEAERVCELLTDTGLLESPAPGRYRYHDLVRLFARRRAEESYSEYAIAVRNLLDFYLATGKRVLVAIQPHIPLADQLPKTYADPLPIPDPPEAWTWISAETDGIIDACWLVGADADSRALAASLTRVLDVTRHSSARGRRLLDVADRIARDAAASNDTFSEAVARHTKGCVLYFFLGDSNAAIAELYLAREAAMRGSHVFERAEAEIQIAQFLFAFEQHEKVIELLESALDGYRELGNQDDEAETLAAMAEPLARLGHFDEAFAAATRARDLHRQLGATHGEATALLRSGNAFSFAGQLTRALEDLRASAALFETLGDRSWRSKALERIAAVCVLVGDAQAATEAASTALELSRDVGFRIGQGRALATLGHAAALASEPADPADPASAAASEQARAYWQEAYDVLKAAGSPEADPLAALLSSDD